MLKRKTRRSSDFTNLSDYNNLKLIIFAECFRTPQWEKIELLVYWKSYLFGKKMKSFLSQSNIKLINSFTIGTIIKNHTNNNSDIFWELYKLGNKLDHIKAW